MSSKYQTSAALLLLAFGMVSAAGLGDDLKLLTTVDNENPHLVSEVVTNLAVSCYITGSDLEGEVLTLTCPSDCQNVTEKLWGDQYYRADSYICAAAIHNGRIEANKGGTVTVRKIAGRPSYKGRWSNGIFSRASESGNRTLVFQDAAEAKENLYAVSCFAKADFTSEDRYLAICPAGCDMVSDNAVWGTGKYSGSSYLCAAAIHGGKFPAEKGGRIAVVKRPWQSSFNGSTQNGITSQSLSIGQISYEMEECPQNLSAVLSVGCSFRADRVLEDFFTVICPTRCGEDNSDVYGEGPYAENSHVCGAAVHNGLIEGALGGRVTVQKHAVLSNYFGSKRNGVTSQAETNKASFVVGGALKRRPNLLRVSCDTTADMLAEDSFVVECPRGCMFHSWQGAVYGSKTYTTSSKICFAALHAGIISDQNGGPVTVRKIGKQDWFNGTTENQIESLEWSTKGEAFTFGGYLEEVKTELRVSCKFAASYVIDLEFTVVCEHGCTRAPPEDWMDRSNQGLYLATTPICLISHQWAGKQISIRRTSGGIKYTGEFEKYVTSESGLVRNPSQGHYLIQDKSFPEEKVLSVGCETTVAFVNSDVYTAICPPGCSGNTLWGTGVYSDDSSLCLAAVHDGRIDWRRGGAVALRKTPGLDAYIGTVENGITSQSKDHPWMTSFVFQNVLQHRTSTFTISCKTMAVSIESEEFGVICPSGCENNYEVWGTENYFEFSLICTAAIHNGTITAQGGLVKVLKTDPQRMYRASLRNGIHSMPIRGQQGQRSFVVFA